MRRLLELPNIEEHEIHSVEEIWTRGVFPFLSQESIVQCLPLYLVSKRWCRWVYILESYVIAASPKGNASYASLAGKIGPTTKSLETVPAIMHKMHYFTKLEKLVFVSDYWSQTFPCSLLCISDTLTSLTLCRNIIILN